MSGREQGFRAGRGRGGDRGRGARGARGGRGSDGYGHGGNQSEPRGSFAGFGRGRGSGRGYSGGSSTGPPLYSGPDGRVPPVDDSIRQIEDDMQGDSKKLQAMNIVPSFPLRPGYGTRGAPVALWANYVQMTPLPSLCLYRYNVSVSPSAVGRKLTQIVRLLLEADELVDLRQDIVTDYKSNLVARRRLPQDDIVLHILYRSEGEDAPKANATSYKIHIKFTDTMSMRELAEYLNGSNVTADYNDKFPMIQAFNILLNHHPKALGNVASIGASKTFSLGQDAAKFDLGRGLEAIRGFFTSVRAATGRLLVNVNVSHAAFYKAGPLDALMIAFQSANKYAVEKFLRKVRVQTTHLKEKRNKKGEVIPRLKSIFAFASPNDGHSLEHPPRVSVYGAGPKQVSFWLQDRDMAQRSRDLAEGKKKPAKAKGPDKKAPSSTSGAYITVYDFFARTYGLQLQRSDLPVINVGTRDSPTYLPPEVCVVVPGQAANTKLNPTQTQGMIRFAVRKPADNARSIVTQGLRTSGLDPTTNALLDRFDISVSSSLITVPGRILDPPKIMYQKTAAQVRFGSWNMNNTKFNKGGKLASWSYLLLSLPGFNDAFDKESLSQTIRTFGQALTAVGIGVAPPVAGQRLLLSDMNDSSLETKLSAAARSLKLLLIILPDANIPLYNRVKRLGDVTHGIHTICSVGHKLAREKGQDQYMANVALKFNLKLGGFNQLVDDPRLGMLRDDKTMVVGIDVTHPSPGSSSKAPSIAGMVASVDRYLGQWPATLRIQSEARKEMVSDLQDMLRTRLALWKSKGAHKEYPENILVYRDGVSEGQYQAVLNEELPLLRKACEEAYPPSDQKKGLPHFTIIIVGKRHHTRFYPTREADADRSSNPKPGTVVDRGVTEARNWDFYLQAHAAIQGTARPAHYFVLIDEVFRQRYKTLPPGYNNVVDIVEETTQALCYTFGRATRAVSICTPAYYADILCERARCYLSSVFDSPTHSAAVSVVESEQEAGATQEDLRIHENLRDTMFYI